MARLSFALVVVLLLGGVALAVWWFYNPQIVLDREKQILIWHAESATFQIETRFGKRRFIPAMKAGDREELASCFQADFTAQLLKDESPTIRQVSSVSERTLERGAGSQQSSDTAGFVDWLLRELEPFAEVDSASQRVLEIHPIERMTDDTGRWQIRFLHSFHGTTVDGGKIAHESEHDVVLEYTSRAQLDTDAVVISWDTIYVKVSTAPHPLMKEVTAGYGLNLGSARLDDNWLIPVEHNSQQKISAAVEDFDRDGYLDIAVATMNSARGLGIPVLLRNIDGKKFEDVTESMGISEWKTTVVQLQFSTAWIDYNNDNYPDLVLGTTLYRNEKGKGFRDVTHNAGLVFLREPMGVTVADYNNDGYSDLYILYQLPDTDRERREAIGATIPWIGDNLFGSENQLWTNDGKGGFHLAQNANADGGKGATFAASWFHLNDDLYPDVYVVNDFGDNVLLRNRGDGTFEDVSDAAGTAGFATSMGVAAGDINNDGTSELYVGNMYSKMGRRIIAHVSPEDYPDGVYRQLEGACAGNRLYSRKPGQSSFSEHSVDMGINAVGWAFAPTFADFNGDGFLDIYANAGFVSFSPIKPDG
ncbi:MAG: VCBS repeat-containing protein [Pirellulales bacterium]|nr:VCBS repeat-containing protein [Pirellulales bacterium]